MDLKNFDIPDKYNYSGISLEAFRFWLEEKAVDDEVIDEVMDYISRIIDNCVQGERGRWLGKILLSKDN